MMNKVVLTRSSWLNYALRDDEAVYWVSIGHYEAVAVGKDTINCPEKLMKISHFNQTNQRLLSIL